MKRLVRCLAFGSIFIYFVVSMKTLTAYGVNWDEISHATRGQAYLYYYFTGKTMYDPSLFSQNIRHSFYQIQQYNYTYQIQNDGDHPPVSDILESFFNFIFYQKLGILGDFESYHFYSVVLVTLFSIALYIWVEKKFGGIVGLVSVFSLLTYPLWYGESHFNSAKDIPEAVYYGLTILVFSSGYVRRSWCLILIAAVLFGLGLGTKFNSVFALITLGIWVSILFIKDKTKRFESIRFSVISLAALLFIGGIIVYVGWPRLWYAGFSGILQSLRYYKDIGTVSHQNKPQAYYFLGFSTYALQWIFYTTPLITLFFFIIGLIKSITNKKNIWSLLILLWFFLPILRVSLPHTAIYGGVRQIMEYIPAMAILAGIGAQAVVTWLISYLVHWQKLLEKNRDMLTIALWAITILSFLPITLKFISLHPNESIYFNPLIGGLKGARDRNIPGWGNSLGSTYRQGTSWLNTHAEPNAKLATVYELISNIPASDLRSDIRYSNTYRSGPKREGEYLIGVTHEGEFQMFYNFQYAQTYLTPLHEVTVEGVPILRVWKNDATHTKPAYLGEEKQISKFTIKKEGRSLSILFSEHPKLVKLSIQYDPATCVIPASGQLQVSFDGMQWIDLPGSIVDFPGFAWFRPTLKENSLEYLFAAAPMAAVRLIKLDTRSCLLKNPLTVSAWAL